MNKNERIRVWGASVALAAPGAILGGEVWAKGLLDFGIVSLVGVLIWVVAMIYLTGGMYADPETAPAITSGSQ